jgi:hypothetical protein
MELLCKSGMRACQRQACLCLVASNHPADLRCACLRGVHTRRHPAGKATAGAARPWPASTRSRLPHPRPTRNQWPADDAVGVRTRSQFQGDKREGGRRQTTGRGGRPSRHARQGCVVLPYAYYEVRIRRHGTRSGRPDPGDVTYVSTLRRDRELSSPVRLFLTHRAGPKGGVGAGTACMPPRSTPLVAGRRCPCPARASALSTPKQKNPTRPANSCAPAPASLTHHTAHRAHVNARVFSLLWCAPGARCRGWAILSRRPCAVRCGAVRCGPERGASVRSTGLSSVRPRLNSVTLTGRCEISGEPVRWCHGPVRLHVALFEGKRVL